MTKQFTTYKQRHGHDINGVRPVMIPDEDGGWVSRHDAENFVELLEQTQQKLESMAYAFSEQRQRIAELEAQKPIVLSQAMREHITTGVEDESALGCPDREFMRDADLLMGKIYATPVAASPLAVKLPESFYPDGDIECPKVMNEYEVIEAIRAAGGQVEGE